MFKNIFGRIWAAWGLVSFVLTFLIILGPSMCSYLFKDEKKGQAYFIAVSKIWMDVWLFLVGCSVKVTGKENFKKGENYVVVYNHNALLDVPLSAPYIPGPNKTIAKDSFAKVPLFGWFYTRGSVLVNRKSDKSRIKSLDEMKKTLAAGMHMCLYPEGTRNKTKEPMKSFYTGNTNQKKYYSGCDFRNKNSHASAQNFFLLSYPIASRFSTSGFSRK